MVSRGGAHPRSRGAHETMDFAEAWQLGSSPLARGSPSGFQNDVVPGGLIPARAGLTGRGSATIRQGRAHPRSRGAHTYRSVATFRDPGSSPLARGSQRTIRRQSRGAGLIPARAGLTARSPCRGPPAWAHPRSRGAHISALLPIVTTVGSSPLARGSRRHGERRPRGPGLIPARAGLTPRSSRPRSGGRAHPRSRGAHASTRVNRRPSPGSSPLARGSREHAGQQAAITGLIPARAGLTADVSPAPADPGAHPRSRGAHRRWWAEPRWCPGSSPLARGSRAADLAGDRGRGLIPARAGLT